MKHLAAIALGTNLPSAWGDLKSTLNEAIKRIGALGRVQKVSSFHETEPVGYLDQPRFVNGALLLETDLQPLELLHNLLAIERSMGRDRMVVAAKGPRVIDLDLLLLDNVILQTTELTLPHPALAQRLFVLQPLAEIAPQMREPVSGLTVEDLLKRLSSETAN